MDGGGSHDSDGLGHRLCPLQRRPDEVAIVHLCAQLSLAERLQSAEGRLADDKLVLVHVPHDVIGFCRLVNLAEVHARIPVVDRLLGAGRDVALAGQPVEGPEQRGRICRVIATSASGSGP